MNGTLNVHVFTGFTGWTGLQMVKSLSAQFQSADLLPHPHPRLRTVAEVVRGFEDVKKIGGIIFYTFMDRRLAEFTERTAKELGIRAVDLSSEALNAVAAELNMRPLGIPGHLLDINDLRRMSAIQYTVDHDDGSRLEDLNDADVALVGTSRTGKTPACMMLAGKHNLKAANIPLILNMPIPEELERLPKGKVYFLDMHERRLIQLRETRHELLGEDKSVDSYIDPEQVINDLRYSRRVFNQHYPGWTRFWADGISVEDLADKIANSNSARYPKAN